MNDIILFKYDKNNYIYANDWYREEMNYHGDLDLIALSIAKEILHRASSSDKLSHPDKYPIGIDLNRKTILPMLTEMPPWFDELRSKVDRIIKQKAII